MTAEQFAAREQAVLDSGSKVSLDLLVNNAGIGLKEGLWNDNTASAEQIRDALLLAKDEDWANEFAVNASSERREDKRRVSRGSRVYRQ